ncbi:Magnesium transporter NIPA2 [Blattella germanica]|nr:Magnesium transporter NIPA2 [Blattella germanica]
MMVYEFDVPKMTATDTEAPKTHDSVSSQPYDSTEFYIGLLLAVSSSVFIVGIGEAANFAAYAFAPASLVTPLGALSVLVAAVLSSKFLNENLNLLGKVYGLCVVCLGIHSYRFITYVVAVTCLSVFIALCIGPRYGHRNVVVYVTLCSAVGSLTVMGCKGLGLALKETLAGDRNEMGNWLTWVFLVTVIVCITIQMNYLNKALDLFNTGIVTPVYYVLFTTLVIVASMILFREWKHLKGEDMLGNVCGFLTVIMAIILLNAFRDMDVSMLDVKGLMRPKRDMLAPCRDNRRGLGASYGSPDMAHNSI